MRVIALEAVGPIGGGGGEDGAGVRVEAEAGGAVAADLPFFIPLDVIGVPADGAGAEDFEGLRRAVLVRGEGPEKWLDTLVLKSDI
jgi:hypothetical protein